MCTHLLKISKRTKRFYWYVLHNTPLLLSFPLQECHGLLKTSWMEDISSITSSILQNLLNSFALWFIGSNCLSNSWTSIQIMRSAKPSFSSSHGCYKLMMEYFIFIRSNIKFHKSNVHKSFGCSIVDLPNKYMKI